MSDLGTNWFKLTEANLNGDAYSSQKLTFGDGVGDAPDDWYIPYSNPESNLIEVAAYIVTAGGSTVEEAEEDPHASSYHDYKDVDGIARPFMGILGMAKRIRAYTSIGKC